MGCGGLRLDWRLMSRTRSLGVLVLPGWLTRFSLRIDALAPSEPAAGMFGAVWCGALVCLLSLACGRLSPRLAGFKSEYYVVILTFNAESPLLTTTRLLICERFQILSFHLAVDPSVDTAPTAITMWTWAKKETEPTSSHRRHS